MAAAQEQTAEVIAFRSAFTALAALDGRKSSLARKVKEQKASLEKLEEEFAKISGEHDEAIGEVIRLGGQLPESFYSTLTRSV